MSNDEDFVNEFKEVSIYNRLSQVGISNIIISEVISVMSENNIKSDIKDKDLYVVLYNVYISIEDNLPETDILNINDVMKKMNINMARNELSSRVSGRYSKRTKIDNMYSYNIQNDNIVNVIKLTYREITESIISSKGIILYKGEFTQEKAIEHIISIYSYAITSVEVLSNKNTRILASIFISLYLKKLYDRKILLSYKYSNNKISDIINSKGKYNSCHNDVKKSIVDGENLIDICNEKINEMLDKTSFLDFQ